jgi:HTH-type transcriptional regulator / antitoxin HigA
MITTTPIASPSSVDIKVYRRLIGNFAPKVIETEDENEAALAIVEKLLGQGDKGRSPEEQTALDLLATLIEQYEARVYSPAPGDPLGALKLLMESNNLRATDIAELFGSRAKISEVLAGKRTISKEQAKRLGRRFGVSPAVFI